MGYLNIPRRTRGEAATNRTTKKFGYKYAVDAGMRILEHRYVMEKHIGRKLRKD